MAKTGPIIILEDDTDDQELVQEALKDIGVANNVIFFTHGKEALEYLAGTPEQPFLIISDVNLPGMSGLDFQKSIQDNEYLRKKSIPFIFFSTSDNRFIIEQAYEQTVQGYFQKPSSFKELKEILIFITDYWSCCKHPNS